MTFPLTSPLVCIYTKLQTSIEQLHTTLLSSDVFLFLDHVSSIREHLSQMEHHVRSERASFGTRLPTMMLLCILQFVEEEEQIHASHVSSSWHQALASSTASTFFGNTLKVCEHTRFGKSGKIWPFGLAVSEDHVVVSCWETDVVQIRSAKNGRVMTRIENPDFVWALACDEEGVIYILGPQRIAVYAPDGHRIRTWNHGSNCGSSSALFVRDGTVIMTRPVITIFFTLQGIETQTWREGGHGIAMLGEEIFLLHRRKVRVMSKTGVCLRQWNLYSNSTSLAVDNSRVYVSCTMRVQVFTLEGKPIWQVASPPTLRNSHCRLAIHKDVLWLSKPGLNVGGLLRYRLF
jgi:hypothetical protein